MKRVVVIAVWVLLLLPGRASADQGSPGLPTTGPVHLPMVESLEPVAEAYWAARGVTLPQVEVFVVADTPVGLAFGEEPGTRIWLTEEAFKVGAGLTARTNLCEIYLHERGHNAGLAHYSGDPIMDPSFLAREGLVVPKCFQWGEAGFKAAL